jgi:uncharacterized membrane protein
MIEVILKRAEEGEGNIESAIVLLISRSTLINRHIQVKQLYLFVIYLTILSITQTI